MYKIKLENTVTHQTYEQNVVDGNNGEKLYFRFSISTYGLEDGEYNLTLFNEQGEVIAEDLLRIGDYNSKSLQYKKGENTYISVTLTPKVQKDKKVVIDKIETTVIPDFDNDSMQQVLIDAKPLYDGAYQDGHSMGYVDGYSSGTTDGIATQKSKLTDITITENGIYTKEDGYKTVDVNVVPNIIDTNISIPASRNNKWELDAKASGVDGYGHININTSTSSQFANSEGMDYVYSSLSPYTATTNGVINALQGYNGYSLVFYNRGVITNYKPHLGTEIVLWVKPLENPMFENAGFVGSMNNQTDNSAFVIRNKGWGGAFEFIFGDQKFEYPYTYGRWYYLRMNKDYIKVNTEVVHRWNVQNFDTNNYPLYFNGINCPDFMPTDTNINDFLKANRATYGSCSVIDYTADGQFIQEIPFIPLNNGLFGYCNSYFNNNGTISAEWNKYLAGISKLTVNVDTQTPYNEGLAQGKLEQKALLQPLSVTSNGTYQTENGYSPISVNITDGVFYDVPQAIDAVLNQGVACRAFVRGQITQVYTTTFNAQYGNIDYSLGDFYIYRGYGLDGAKIQSDTDLQVGDIVTIEGQLSIYRGRAQFSAYSKVRQLCRNGEGGGGGSVIPNPIVTPVDFSTPYLGATIDRDIVIDCKNMTSLANFFKQTTFHKTNGVPLINTENVTRTNSTFAYSNIVTPPLFDTSKVTTMGGMFLECQNLTSIPLYDTSKVTNMVRTFINCYQLTSIPLLDTSSVTNMSRTFEQCRELTTIPLLNTSNVQHMYGMFNYCSKLTTLPQIDTSKATDMTCMLQGCSSLTTIPQLNTSSVTNMSWMFNGCTNLTSIPQLNTSRVTNMTVMFGNCTNLTTVPLLDTSSVTDMNYMFEGCTNLTSIPQLDTSKVTNMGGMFRNCSKLTTVPLLDTSSVTNMNSMFQNCTNLTSIPQLNTSSVTDMNSMFNGCRNLTSIPLLDCTNVTDINYMFDFCPNLTNLGGFANLKGVLNLVSSKLITRESMINVFNTVADATNIGTMGIQISQEVYNRLTPEDIAIATNKGWIVQAA